MFLMDLQLISVILTCKTHPSPKFLKNIIQVPGPGIEPGTLHLLLSTLALH